MSTEDIDELAESIKKDGLINPLKVYKNNDGSYELLGGHRRCWQSRRLLTRMMTLTRGQLHRSLKTDDKLREQMQIIQDNAQRDMTSEDKKNLFQKLNDIFDTAEAEGNYAITGGQTKSDWISVNLGISRSTVFRWLKEIQNKKESPEEEKPVERVRISLQNQQHQKIQMPQIRKILHRQKISFLLSLLQ